MNVVPQESTPVAYQAIEAPWWRCQRAVLRLRQNGRAGYRGW